MVKSGKIDNVGFNYELHDTKSVNLTEPRECLFSYELSAPKDTYQAKSKKSDWNNDLTNNYMKLGLGTYTWTKLNGLNNAIINSQSNLIDLLRFYEGNGNNYEADMNYKDANNITTYGFGLTTTAMKAIGNYDKKNKKIINIPKTQTQAYEQLLKYLNDVSLRETKIYLDDIKYNNLPNGVKAALLDYHFKNGINIMNASQLKTKLETALKTNTSENWAAFIKELVYAKLASSNASKDNNPGLYRRSLSRVILAAIDLRKLFTNSNDIATIDRAVKDIYEKAKNCSKANSNNGLNEIEAIYETYREKTSLNIKTDATQNQNKNRENKYTIPYKIELYSVANKLIPDIIPNGVDKKELHQKVVNEIIILNNIQTEGMIEQGTQLTLPEFVTINNTAKIRLKSPSEWKTLVSQPQETDDSADELDINNESVRVIDLLNKECPNPIFSCIVADSNLQCATYQYTVLEGNTIYSLALRYGVDWKTLLANNNMTENSTLKIGDKININKIIYTVQQGDNLTQIAKRYGLTVNYIRDINNLDNVNNIKIGQQLEIPGYIYIIKKGDNLTQIAKRAGINVSELVKLNGLNSPDQIKEGNKLLILFNDADYNISESNIATSKDDEGNEITTIKSDNVALKKRQYLSKNRNKKTGKYTASTHIFMPTVKKGSLSGKTIIVNAGHGYMPSGSMDNGAPGLRGREHEVYVNYDNAMRLIQRLQANGAKVIYLQGYEGKSRYNEDLISQEIRKLKNKADLFISIHANSSIKPPDTDRTEIYYHRNAKSSDGKKLANIFESKLDKYQEQKTYATSRTCDYQVLRTAKSKDLPAILWEVAFINNTTGSNRLNNNILMNKYADLLTESVVEYLKGKTSSSTSSATSVRTTNNTHIVKSGETLYSIAKKYNVTTSKLIKWNKLKNDKIYAGQSLIIKK